MPDSTVSGNSLMWNRRNVPHQRPKLLSPWSGLWFLCLIAIINIMGIGKKFTINRWLFVVLFVIYSIASFIAFFFIFSGWTGFLYISPVLIMCYGLILITLILSSIRKTFQHNYDVNISFKYLLITLGLQVVTVILGGGDCGDGFGTHSILQSIFSPQTTCVSENVSMYSSIIQFSYIVLLIYIVSIVFFIIKTLNKNKTLTTNV